MASPHLLSQAPQCLEPAGLDLWNRTVCQGAGIQKQVAALAREGDHRPEAPPAHLGGHGMGRGDGIRAGQAQRPDRPGSSRAELHHSAHEGTAAPGGCVRNREGVGVGFEAGRQAGIRAACADGDPLRRRSGGPPGRRSTWTTGCGSSRPDARRRTASTESRSVAVRWRSSKRRGRSGRGSPHVFLSMRGKPLDGTAFTRMLKRLATDFVPHGLRSSSRDWAAEETGHPCEVAEAALAMWSATKSRPPTGARTCSSFGGSWTTGSHT